MPSTPAIGVLISWLRFVKKAVLDCHASARAKERLLQATYLSREASLAASSEAFRVACSLCAFLSASSARWRWVISAEGRSRLVCDSEKCKGATADQLTTHNDDTCDRQWCFRGAAAQRNELYNQDQSRPCEVCSKRTHPIPTVGHHALVTNRIEKKLDIWLCRREQSAAFRRSRWPDIPALRLG